MVLLCFDDAQSEGETTVMYGRQFLQRRSSVPHIIQYSTVLVSSTPTYIVFGQGLALRWKLVCFGHNAGQFQYGLAWPRILWTRSICVQKRCSIQVVNSHYSTQVRNVILQRSNETTRSLCKKPSLDDRCLSIHGRRPTRSAWPSASFFIYGFDCQYTRRDSLDKTTNVPSNGSILPVL